MPETVIQPSFGAGELSPSLYARVDLQKYHTGAAMLRNFFVDYRGGASTRPGLKYIGTCNIAGPGQPVLIPFVVATVAAYAIEAGNFYFRFISNGAYVTENPTTISGVSNSFPVVITDNAHGYSNNDAVEISGIVGVSGLNGRTLYVENVTTNTYTLFDQYGSGIDTTNSGAYVSGGQAARVLTLATPYAVGDLPLVKYTQSADVLTLTHPSYPVYNLTQTSPNSFSIDQDIIGPTQVSPTNLTVRITSTPNFDTAYGYLVTSVSLDGKEESLPVFPSLVAGIPLGSQDGAVAVLHWQAAATPASYYKVYRTTQFRARGASAGTPAPMPSVFGYIGQALGTTFTDADIAPDFTQTPPQYQDPFSPGQIAQVSVTNGGSTATTQYIIPLIFTANGPGSGGAGYAIVDPNSNAVVAVVITNYGKNYTNALVITDTAGVGTYSYVLGQLSGTYPAAPGYFQQRRILGGTNNLPESFVCSQPGLYDNFDTTPTSNAADSITASIASRQVNAIKSFIAMPTGLVIFTTGSGFLVSGGGQNAAITPQNIVAFPQASSGANDLPPLQINYDILYCQNRGAVVRDLAFNFYVQSYTGTDRSVLASHLFFGFDLTSWTYAEEPFRLIQVCRSDGTLLNFTYVPEQEEFAWTHYDTQGFFRSIISIPEGPVNAVYTIVQRYTPRGPFYYVERFDARIWSAVTDSWCLDAALSLPLSTPDFAIQFTSATTGAAQAIAQTPSWTPDDVGQVIWNADSNATITNFVSASVVDVIINIPFQIIPNSVSIANPEGIGLVYNPGLWVLVAPVTSVSGLDHLEGMPVVAVCDGTPQPETIVVNGTVAVPLSSRIVVGLPYQCQLQTLKLDTGDPTIQGKRKTIVAVTLRINNTVPIAVNVGPDFDSLTPLPINTPIPFTPPVPFYSDDIRIPIFSDWTTHGQVAVQIDDPLPATILGIIPELVVGDTGR